MQQPVPAEGKQPQNSTRFPQVKLEVSSVVESVLEDGNSHVLVGLGDFSQKW